MGVLVVAHHKTQRIGTEPVQFGLSHQSVLQHGDQARDRRRSAEVIESLPYFPVPLMDEFVQCEVAFMRRHHGVVVAQGSALVQYSTAESVECGGSYLLEHPPIGL